VHVLIGIDDTDNLDTIGTGQLSRMLAENLCERGLLHDWENTRHQFLVDPAIPYTSHNSSACISARSSATLDALAEAARDFLLAHEHEGANPGLCVADAASVPDALVALGRRAQREVLDFTEVQRGARSLGPRVWWTGQTGQGVIGAMGGVGLRSTGQDGRYIALRGIRDLCGVLRAGEIVARSGVARVVAEDGRELLPDDPVDTGDWVRPWLRDGRPVFVVRRSDGRWVPAERRNKDR
jgi:hypothetical protein